MKFINKRGSLGIAGIGLLIFVLVSISFTIGLFAGTSSSVVLLNGGGTCGDGVCRLIDGEDPTTCPEDCGSGGSCPALSNGVTQTQTYSVGCSIYEPAYHACGSTCTNSINIPTTPCTVSITLQTLQLDDEGNTAINGNPIVSDSSCTCNCGSESGNGFGGGQCAGTRTYSIPVFFSPGSTVAASVYGYNDCLSRSAGIWGSASAAYRVTTVQCNPGYVCASEPTCGGVQCVPGCTIGGQFYPDGTNNSANPCQVCNIASSYTSWTNKPDGSTCGTGGTCQTGVCNTYTCPSAGTSGPSSNTYAGCRASQPLKSSISALTCAPGQTCYLCNPGYTWSVSQNSCVLTFGPNWCADLQHPTFYQNQTIPNLNTGSPTDYNQCCYGSGDPRQQCVPGADYSCWASPQTLPYVYP